MNKEEFKVAILGILAENRDHPIPAIRHPQCNKCKHLRRENRKAVCKAFPNGIPREIFLNEVDHKKPYKGDNGVRFEPKDK